MAFLATDERRRLLRRHASLKNELQSWLGQAQEISQLLLPRNGRYTVTDRNKGGNRHNRILDSTGTKAIRVLGAGLMSGATSPARPWIRLAATDKELMKSDNVKLWLAEVTEIILDVFNRSNVYRALHSMYEEIGTFGTAACIVMDDFENVIHLYPLTYGEYMIAADYKGNINALYREFQKTVGDLVEEFGKENCSASVQNQYDRGHYDNWVTIVHAIEARRNRDTGKLDDINMPWQSTYFEPGSNENEKCLRNSGMRTFRVLAPRWNATGGDVYGTGPGAEVLGDVKQLQHQQLRKAQGIDYMSNPPIQVPTAYKGNDAARLPGGTMYVDSVGAGGGVRTAFEVNLRLDFLLQDIQDVRQRIREGFFTDLFLMLANSVDSSRKTATEVAELHEEKMLMLGPVLERLHNELLRPLIDMVFDRCMEVGLLPPPPEELQGRDIDVEFVSILAQAQRAVSTNAIDRFMANVGGIAAIKPEVLDRIDIDKWVEEYADMLGVPPSLLLSDDRVQAIRDAKAQAAQQAAQQEAIANGAVAAKNLAGAPTDGRNALTDVMQNLTGYN